MITRTKLTIPLALFAALTLISIFTIYYTHTLPTEEQTTTPLCTYTHIATYNYTAKLIPNQLYNQTTLGPGEGTLYMRIIDHINLTLNYQFTCTTNYNITSTQYNTTIQLESPQKWTKTFTTTDLQEIFYLNINTQNSSITLLLNTTKIDDIVRVIGIQTGTTSTTYNLKIKPQIQTTAQTNAGNINEVFTPTLTVEFKKETLEGNIILIQNLQQTKPGQITQTQTTPLPWVTTQRYTSYAFTATTTSGLTLTTTLYLKTKPTKPRKKPLKEIITPYQEIILESTQEPTTLTTIKVPTLEDLIKISENLLKPVFHTTRPPTATKKRTTHSFYIIDGQTKYEYTTKGPKKLKKKK